MTTTRRSHCAATVFAGLVSAGTTVVDSGRVQPPASSTLEPAEPSSPPSLGEDESAHRMHWTYPRFHLGEVIASSAASVAAVVLEVAFDDPPDRGWNHGIIFDDSVRSAIRADSFETRERIDRASDVMWPALQFFPVLESLFVPLATDRLNTDVALQMTLINWEAQVYAGVITRAAHSIASRGRPSLEECDTDPDYTQYCDPESTGRRKSFISGHASMAFTGAGLTCAHHLALPMYGSPIADAVPCVVTVSSATALATLRLVADQHYATDAIAGMLVGGGFGFAMPYLVHYANETVKRADSDEALFRGRLVPLGTPAGLGLAYVGVF